MVETGMGDTVLLIELFVQELHAVCNMHKLE